MPPRRAAAVAPETAGDPRRPLTVYRRSGRASRGHPASIPGGRDDKTRVFIGSSAHHPGHPPFLTKREERTERREEAASDDDDGWWASGEETQPSGGMGGMLVPI